ncbi:MAG: isochorismatase family protein [Azospirillaceae bacterium]
MIERAQSSLVVVDVQQRLLPAISRGAAALERIALLVRAAAALGVPVVATEQYPRGLGHTVAEVGLDDADAAVVEKTFFDAIRAPAVRDALMATGRPRPVVCGFEAHVCVLQTVLGSLREGWRPVVVADAVGSRRRADHEAALARLRAEGATVATAEMVVFEWLGTAEDPAFSALLPAIRALGGEEGIE